MRNLARSDARQHYVSVYPAPEQVSTKFGTPDWRTGVYQLRALIYKTGTERTPFQSEEDMLMRAIAGETPSKLLPPEPIQRFLELLVSLVINLTMGLW